ncbi:MAG: hypothetical protein IJM38_09695 [Ruminococcus sp.]|nr:hypothetical protein [Ruminococcus sp.]
MNRKFKKVIKDSFVFPESEHRDEFLDQAGLLPENEEKRRLFIPIQFRITAAATACVLAIGLWNTAFNRSLKNDLEPHNDNIITTDSTEGVDSRPSDDDNNNKITTDKNTVITTSNANNTSNFTFTTTGYGYTATGSKAGKVNTAVTTAAAVPEDRRSTVKITTKSNKGSGGNIQVTTAVIPPKGPETTRKPEETVPVIDNDDDLEKQIIEYERSIIMKKFLATLAASASLVNIVPVSSFADYQPVINKELQSYFDSIDNGAVNADIDGNGVIDRYDAFLLNSYAICKEFGGLVCLEDELTQEQIAAAKAKGDLNRDGKVNTDDSDILNRYYTYKNGYILDDYDMNNYYNKDGNHTFNSYSIVYDLKDAAIETGAMYNYVNNIMQNDPSLFDVNENGTTDIFDMYEYFIYTYIEKLQYEPVDQSHTILSEKSFNNSKNIDEKYGFRNDIVLLSLICNNEFDPSWIDKQTYVDYYNQLIDNADWLTDEYIDLNEEIQRVLADLDPDDEEGAREYTEYLIELNEKYQGLKSKKVLAEKYKLMPECFNTCVKEATIDAGMTAVEDNSWKINDYFGVSGEDFDNDLFNSLLDQYEQDVLNGTVAPPDVNGDRKVDRDDSSALETYFDDLMEYKTVYESELNEKTWNYIDKQLDINNNGICGDLYDIYVAITFIVKDVGKEELDNAVDAYYAKLDEQNQIAEIEHIKYLEGLKGITVTRSGDANNSGSVNMADAVIIMQNNCNPDDYQLSPVGEFNADVNNTGDGVTLGDALTIQRRLVGLE